MSRWIVSTIPPWLLLLGLIVIIAGGSVLLGMAVRSRFPRITQDEHNDALRFGYGVIGFVYAFFIGFVVSAMWGQINDADSLARTEGAAGVQLARDASVFDPADGDRIRLSLLSYERAAEAEWPMVAIVGAMVAANLFLVLELSHPFVGDISTSPEPLHRVIEVLTHLPS
jgi:hypothetical protein